MATISLLRVVAPERVLEHAAGRVTLHCVCQSWLPIIGLEVPATLRRLIRQHPGDCDWRAVLRVFRQASVQVPPAIVVAQFDAICTDVLAKVWATSLLMHLCPAAFLAQDAKIALETACLHVTIIVSLNYRSNTSCFTEHIRKWCRVGTKGSDGWHTITWQVTKAGEITSLPWVNWALGKLACELQESFLVGHCHAKAQDKGNDCKHIHLCSSVPAWEIRTGCCIYTCTAKTNLFF